MLAAGAVTSDRIAAGAVTTDKIGPGAVKTSQIDDAGLAAYTTFEQEMLPVTGERLVPFSKLAAIVPTTGIPPVFSFTVDGLAFGLITGFAGNEGLSEPYSIVVQGQVSGALDPETRVGSIGRLSYTRNGRTTSFTGTITAFTVASADDARRIFTARIEAPLVYLARTTDYRVFQEKAPKDIVQQVYRSILGSDPAANLTASYSPREFVIQYGESDLNFINRLMEYEGIFYYFDYSANPPAMTLADAASVYLPSDNATLLYYGNVPTAKVPAGSEYIRTFQKSAQQSTIRAAVSTYNFQAPSLSYSAQSTGAKGVGEYFEFGSTTKSSAYSGRLAAIRQGRENVKRSTLSGSSTSPNLHPGYTFTLNDQTPAGLSGSYVVTQVRHAGFIRTAGGVNTLHYANEFEAIPASLTYRPALRTPRHHAENSTAIVTGPAGETTHVDASGRVKVQFHWDRYGVKNQQSSAWIRVASPSAGAGHGLVFLPKVGDEVLVSFILGDPDQPIVVGSLFNGANRPPMALPDNKFISLIQSSSTDGQINRIRFDDRTGGASLSLESPQVNISGTLALNGGAIFKNVATGQNSVGSSASGQTTVTIIFPKPFASTPRILITPQNDAGFSNVADTFVATVRNVSTKGCVVNIVRVDSPTGWSQNLRLNWIAWE